KDDCCHPDALPIGAQQPEHLRLRGLARAPGPPSEVVAGLRLIPIRVTQTEKLLLITVETGHFAGEFAALVHLNPHCCDRSALARRPAACEARRIMQGAVQPYVLRAH